MVAFLQLTVVGQLGENIFKRMIELQVLVTDHIFY